MRNIVLSLIGLFLVINLFAQESKDIKCRIWRPRSYCEMPDSLTGFNSLNCIFCNEDNISCSDINKMGFVTAVWITIPVEYGNHFKIKSGFKNISLIKKSDGKIVHPAAIKLSYNNKYKNRFEEKYLSSNIKVFWMNYHLDKNLKKFDLILIFPSAEKGDKIVFDHYFKTEIQ